MGRVVSWGTIFNSNNASPNRAKLTALENGTFVSVWIPEAGNKVFYQIYGANGVSPGVLGFDVPGSNLAGLSEPTVVGLSDGRVAIAWTQTFFAPGSATATYTSIYGAILSSDGRVSKAPHILKSGGYTSAVSNLSYKSPVLTALDNGGFVLSAVSTEVTPGPLPGIPGPIVVSTETTAFDSNGTSKFAEKVPNGYGTPARMVDIGGGQYVVVTASPHEDAGKARVKLDIRNRDSHTTDITFTDTHSSAGFATNESFSVSSLGDEKWNGIAHWNTRFVIAYKSQDKIIGNVRDNQSDIHRGGFEISGANIGKFSIAALLNGYIAVTWVEGDGIYTAVYAQNGAVIGEKTLVANFSSGSEIRHLYADYLEDGRYVVNWEVKGAAAKTTSQSQIYDPRIEEGAKTGIVWTEELSDAIKNKQFAGTFSHDKLTARDGNDTLYGHDGNDTLDGGEGDDVLYGGGGSDSLMGSIGADHFYGGGGYDYIDYSNAPNTPGFGGVKVVRYDADLKNNDYSNLNAGSYAAGDRYDNASIAGIRGSAHADELHGWWEAEEIRGHSGNDYIDGYEGDDWLFGDDGNDVIYGNIGNDTLFGGADNDTLVGGVGGDNLQGDDGFDYASYENAVGRVVAWLNFNNKSREGDAVGDTYIRIEGLIGSRFNDVLGGDTIGNVLIGGDGNDTLHGDAGNDTLKGGADSDSLYGGANDDELDGGAGADYLNGGSGNDIYYIDSALDRIEELSGNDIAYVTVASYTLAEDVAVETLEAGNKNASITLIGNNLANTIIGGDKNDILDGGINGSNMLKGGLGGDTYHVRHATDLIVEGADSNPANIDTVWLHTNVYHLDKDAQVEVIKAADAWLDQKLTIGGSDHANTIYGGNKNDVINGGGGRDVLYGGAGDDTYILTDAQDVIKESSSDGGSGIDTIKLQGSAFGSSIKSYVLDSDVEILDARGITGQMDGKIGGMSLIGNTLENTIYGSTGNDTLTGSAAPDGKRDELIGGAGDDTYVIASVEDVIRESTSYDGAGIDTVQLVAGTAQGGFGTTLTVYALADDLEVLDASNVTGAMSLNGNAAANTIIGGSGNDLLSGGDPDDGEVDVLRGGEGDDTYLIDAGDIIEEYGSTGGDKAVLVGSTFGVSVNTYTLANGVEILNAKSISGAMELIGNVGENTIMAGSGSDTLTGSVDAQGEAVADGHVDVLQGGAGDDTYILAEARDVVDESVGAAGKDTIKLVGGNFAGTTFSLAGPTVKGQIEVLDASAATGGVTLVGNARANTIISGAGADTLDGGVGQGNELRGGEGNDTFIIRNLDDVALEEASGGTNDTAIITVKGYVISTLHNIENIVYSLEGGGGTDPVVGSDGNDTLVGSDGSDTLVGGRGDDTYHIHHKDNVIEEDLDPSGGFDTAIIYIDEYTLEDSVGVEQLQVADSVTGGVKLTGNDQANTIIGGVGDDTLSGGGAPAGAFDILRGGEGNDTYVLTDAASVSIEELGGSDADKVVLAGDTFGTPGHTAYTLAGGVEILDASGIAQGGMELTGNDLDNTITGTADADTLQGGEGNDALDGGTGADNMVGGAGNDTYYIDDVNDVALEELAGGTNDTAIITVSGYNVASLHNIENILFRIVAGPDGDTSTGGDGNDTFIGGAGNDYFDGMGGDDILVGADGDDTLIGGRGNDTLDSGTGVDHMDGGADDDIYHVRDTRAQIVETIDASGGFDIAYVYVDEYAIGDRVGVEQLQVGDGVAFGVKLTGNMWANTLIGGNGNDTLVGGGAPASAPALASGDKDLLRGGEGDDTYVLMDAVSAIIEELGSTAADKVELVGDLFGTVHRSYVLAGGVEILDASGVTGGGMTLTGNGLNNTITGTARADVLQGGLGNDVLIGGGASDGEDLLQGGAGNDTYIVSDPGSVRIEEQAGEANGRDTILLLGAAIGARYSLEDKANVENLTAGEGTGEIALIGNGLDNVLTGNGLANTLDGADGDDTLDGGGGRDILRGGSGNDTYLIRHADDVVEDADGARDVAEVWVDEYRLADDLGIEVLQVGKGYTSGALNSRGNLKGAKIVGGNSTAALIGGDHGDTLDGGAGGNRHVFDGGLGDDVYYLRNAGDTMVLDAGGYDFAYLYASNFGGSMDEAKAFGEQLKANFGLDDFMVVPVGGSEADVPPTGLSLSYNGIEELSPGGTEIGTFTVKGVEPGLHEVEILHNGTWGKASDLFRIEGNRLVLAEGAHLDYEQALYHDLTLRVVGNGQVYELPGPVRISVIDVKGEYFDGGDAVTNDRVLGGVGRDILKGGLGDDTLSGGFGDDVLEGGAGRDVFVFDLLPQARDRDEILDFTSGEDKIWLVGSQFKLGNLGEALRGENFVLGSQATSLSHRIIYDRVSGWVYYDADGNKSGGAAKVALVQLKNNPVLQASDFVVVSDAWMI